MAVFSWRRFGLLQPDACHDARFMADVFYLLTLHLTKSVLSVMPEEDYVHIDLLCSMSYIGGNDLEASKFLFSCREAMVQLY